MDTKQIRETMLKWIDENYDLSNFRMKIKFDHTDYVAQNIVEIANSLNFNKEDVELAYVLGLLHDFGRFEQLKLQDNYVDFKGFDHANVGAKFLFEDGLINMFDIPAEYYKLLEEGIKEHNKLNINENISDQKIITFCKLIRDADKLDMYRLNTQSTEHLTLTKPGHTQKVLGAIYNNQCVNVRDRKTMLDEILGFVGTIFDLNYDYSKEKLKNMDFYNKFYNNYKPLLNSEDQKTLKQALNYVENTLNQEKNLTA